MARWARFSWLVAAAVTVLAIQFAARPVFSQFVSINGDSIVYGSTDPGGNVVFANFENPANYPDFLMTFDSTSDPPVYFEQDDEGDFWQLGLDTDGIPKDFVPMAGDVDGDSFTDVVCLEVNAASSPVSKGLFWLALPNSQGSDNVVMTTIDFGAGNLHWATVVDPDADGDPDVFGCKLNGGTTSCFLLTNNGAAGFTQTFSADLAGNPIATTTAIGDAANRDLLDDVVVGFDDGSVLLFPNNGAGGYTAPLAVYSTAGGEPISALAVGDTSADGFPDIVVSASGLASSAIVEYDIGMGSYVSSGGFVHGVANPVSAIVADLNMDCFGDFLAVEGPGTGNGAKKIAVSGADHGDVETRSTGSDSSSLRRFDYDDDGDLDHVFASDGDVRRFTVTGFVAPSYAGFCDQFQRCTDALVVGPAATEARSFVPAYARSAQASYAGPCNGETLLSYVEFVELSNSEPEVCRLHVQIDASAPVTVSIYAFAGSAGGALTADCGQLPLHSRCGGFVNGSGFDAALSHSLSWYANDDERYLLGITSDDPATTFTVTRTEERTCRRIVFNDMAWVVAPSDRTAGDTLSFTLTGDDFLNVPFGPSFVPGGNVDAALVLDSVPPVDITLLAFDSPSALTWESPLTVAGVYNLTLTVTDAVGAVQESMLSPVQLTVNPSVAFFYSLVSAPAVVVAGETFTARLDQSDQYLNQPPSVIRTFGLFFSGLDYALVPLNGTSTVQTLVPPSAQDLTHTFTTRGDYTVTYWLSDFSMQVVDPSTLYVAAGPVHAPATVVSFSGGETSPGIKAASLEAYDVYGNPRDAEDPGYFGLNILGPDDVANNLTVGSRVAVATYQGDGVYFFSFELDLIGNYTLYFSANGTVVDVYDINVVPGTPSPQTTTVSGPGLDEVATAFVFTSVTVTVRDQYNNVVSEGGLPVTLGISNPLSKPYLLEPVVDFNNGSYLYEYVLQYGGLWFLEVRLDGTSVEGSPFPVQIEYDCDAGLVSPNPATPCFTCPLGTYSNTIGTECLDCPDGSTTLKNAATGLLNCTCPAGAYTPERVRGVECIPCPAGGNCTGGTTAPVAAPGWYPSAAAAFEFYECPRPEDCLGGDPPQCAEGTTGVQCASCDERWYKLNGECRPCKTNSGALVFLFIFFLWLFLLCVFLFNMVTYNVAKWATLSIAISSLQIVALFGQFPLVWPGFVRTMFEVISFANFNVELAQPECAVPGAEPFFLKWIVLMLLPLIFVVVFLSIYLLVVLPQMFCAARCGGSVERKWPNFAKRPEGEPTEWRFKEKARYTCSRVVVEPATHKLVRHTMIRSWYMLMSISYLPLISVCLKFFPCKRDIDGSFTLRADPALFCYTPAYWGLFVLALLFAPLYGFGIPGGLYYLLKYKFEHMVHFKFVLRYSFLVARYKDEFYYWEVVVLARKLGVVICVIFLPQSPTLQAFLAVASLLLALVMHVHVKPFHQPVHNLIETISMVCAAIILGMGLVATTEEGGARGFANFVIVTTLLFNLGAMAVSFVLDFRRITREEEELDKDVFDEDADEFDETEHDGEDAESMWAAAAGSESIMMTSFEPQLGSAGTKPTEMVVENAVFGVDETSYVDLSSTGFARPVGADFDSAATPRFLNTAEAETTFGDTFVASTGAYGESSGGGGSTATGGYGETYEGAVVPQEVVYAEPSSAEVVSMRPASTMIVESLRPSSQLMMEEVNLYPQPMVDDYVVDDYAGDGAMHGTGAMATATDYHDSEVSEGFAPIHMAKRDTTADVGSNGPDRGSKAVVGGIFSVNLTPIPQSPINAP